VEDSGLGKAATDLAVGVVVGNAIADVDAYRYVTENMPNLTQVTRPECENAYEKNGYPFEAEFLEEYIGSMTAMNENICCYDLQAVASLLSKR